MFEVAGTVTNHGKSSENKEGIGARLLRENDDEREGKEMLCVEDQKIFFAGDKTHVGSRARVCRQ